MCLQHLNSNLTHNQQIQTNLRLAVQVQLEVRALDIIMLLWRANADPLKPAKVDHKNILPVDVMKDDSIIALLLSKLILCEYTVTYVSDQESMYLNMHIIIMETFWRSLIVDTIHFLMQKN